ncbi:MAG: tRNA (adenosine(37)-N6)-threonylcarbamoyltransferase complex ATPase subunit type 1 TsaE [Candidatus Fermentibacteraceae bacterium]|nr:tRNA (adenosine(37)-N6)-threonylcarbamoyltransferase complex ATPase subunit type 1 TsaE [Candidatus Fermentibacteraceae bacterium]
MTKELDVSGLEELACELAASVKPGDRYFLSGLLGAGKSTFARAFIRYLGVEGAIPSPTFIMDSVYSIRESGLVVHHIDLYRLEGHREEMQMLGFEEILDSEAVVLIEWPERMEDYRERRGCTISISNGVTPNSRRVKVEWNLAGH